MSRFRKHLKQTQSTTDDRQMSKNLLNQARKSGQLNLSNRELKEVPAAIWNLNKPPTNGNGSLEQESTANWWEQVDLSKLILASNLLSSLPEQLSELHALTVLDVHDNKLQTLPNAIGSWERLEKLDASHNELQALPDCLPRLEFLTILLLQHNKLQHLPDDFTRLVNLQSIDVSHNDFTVLNQAFASLTKLQRINLSHNKIEKAPNDLSQLPILSYLDLDYNKIATLPSNWDGASSLKELHLRNNLLTALPNLSSCTNLKELYCANNRLENIVISSLPSSLIILELRENKIKSIDASIIDLKELQRLDLANNNISTLPPKMGVMERLKVLNVDGNPMRGLRRDIISKGTHAIIKYLRSRIVENVGDGQDGVNETTSSLPTSVEIAEVTKMHAMAASKSLDLSKTIWSDNSVKLIKDCFDIPLESINLSRTGITELPVPICQFQSSLKVLNLSLNRLLKLSADIGSFTPLTHLDLGSNSLTDLPMELASLDRLVELNLYQNQFSDLPQCIFQLKSLEHLLAGGNKLVSIDVDGLRKLTKLSTLALQNNNITQVPPQLGLITTIRNLQLEGNVFRIPRHNVLQQGTQSVLEYLRNRVPTA